jgi:hypothetical protein
VAAVPGIAKWMRYAGGTGAAEGKYCYTLEVPESTYYIDPISSSRGRHLYYKVKFAATKKSPASSHGGLWHQVKGEFSSPGKAATAAAHHHAVSF